MFLRWNDRPQGIFGWMQKVFMVNLIPNSRYLFFVLLFFDFLKMVLPSFLIISDF